MTADASDIRELATGRTRRSLLFALIGAGIVSCGVSKGGPEQQIQAWIDRGHEAAERKDRGELVAMISPRYADSRGNSRDDIARLFRFYFLRTKDVALLVGVDDIEILGETAAAVALTVAMGARTDSVLGFNADAYRFELELEHDGDEWLLVSGRWSGLGDELR